MPLASGLKRLRDLVPLYFVARTMVLLLFGMLSLTFVFLHVFSNRLEKPLGNIISDPLGISALVLLLLVCLANLYLLIIYPLRESASYPRPSRHPLLSALVVLSFLLFTVFFQLGLQAGANPYVMLSAPAVLVGAVGGLSWRQGITLILAFNGVITLLLPKAVEPFFWGFMLCSQWVVFILFKALIGEFHVKTLLQQRLVELQATQRLLRESVEQDIRCEVARNLHDELGHLATRLSLSLGHYVQQQRQPAPQIVEAQALTRRLHQQVRSIAASWTQVGKIDLKSTLNTLAKQIAQPQVVMHYEHFDGLCSPPTAEAIFRACQEGITNCLRHSDASILNVTLERKNTLYVVTLEDNGHSAQWKGQFGTGLRGVQERLRQLGGELTCEAKAGGFVMQLNIPLHAYEI